MMGKKKIDRRKDLNADLDQLGDMLKQAEQQIEIGKRRRYKVISAFFSVIGALILLAIFLDDGMSDWILVPLLLSNAAAGAIWDGMLGNAENGQGYLVAYLSSFVILMTQLFRVGVSRFLNVLLFPLLLACLPWYIGARFGQGIYESKK